MNDGVAARVISSLLALEDMARQVERVGREGRSPTSGKRLTPLTHEEWDALAGPLGRLQERMHEAALQLAPERMAERRHRAGRAATLQWLTILVGRLEEEIVQDLSPERLEARFGAMSSAEREALASLEQGLRADLKALHDRIGALRESSS